MEDYRLKIWGANQVNLTVNGKKTQLDCATAFGARELLERSSDLVMLNGFQVSEDQVLKENDTLTFVSKGLLPEREALESMMMARHTPEVHEKVKSGSVAIAGLGGLGSNIAIMLARTGIGKLLLVDFDIVEPSNLNRQHYGIRHLGMPKALALCEQIAEINPFVTVETITERITGSNAALLFREYSILCEAFDRPEEKSMLVNTVLSSLEGTVIVAASGMAGYDSSNKIRTVKRMNRLYLCGDYETGAGFGVGLMAPRVQVCAAHQANMVLRLLLGLTEV